MGPGKYPFARVVGPLLCLYCFILQALETLSSPLPSSQISRLKGLYQDLHEALAPLFPPQHPALVAFSLPLPPTPSPLLSAITHIRDALLASRQRCAPVRDTTIDGILHQIDHRSRSASTEELAELLVNSIRSVLELSIDMRNDYSNAVLARASEQELTDMVTSTAETQERRLVLQLWGSKDAMREAWTRWMESFHPENPALLDVPPKRFWILRLIESLGKPYAVTSKLFGLSRSRQDRGNHDPDSSPAGFPEPKNELPPQFLFSGPAIFRLQNHIQALTIAATLKSLVPTARPTASSPRPPLSRASDTTPPAAWTFTERIWALLEPEIGEGDNGPSETKIVNLADEVVMAYRNALSPGMTTLDAHAEQNLRSSVDRILRTDDPVFVLLQKRLLAALSASLLDVSTVEEHSSTVMEGSWPRRQRGVPPSPMQNTQREIRVSAKGFEDPVIAKQCSIAASALRSSVEWVERVWGDSMPY